MNARKLLEKAVENWPAKVLSAAAALLLFVFHRMSTLETRFFSVPLRVETSAGLIPASEYPRVVRISLRGEANAIYPIPESDIEACVDLAKENNGGWYRSPVQVRRKGSAVGVEPLEISVEPMEISIHLDQKISKTAVLSPRLRGSVASGYDLVSNTLLPGQVIVDGPVSALESLEELQTDFIDLDGRNSDFSVIVNIVIPDPLIIVRGNGMAEFRALIRPMAPVRTVEDIPITARGIDSRFKIDFEGKMGSVRLLGDREQLDRFVPPPGFLFVDCSQITGEGEYTLPLSADLPDGLALSQLDPLEITVTAALKQ